MPCGAGAGGSALVEVNFSPFTTCRVVPAAWLKKGTGSGGKREKDTIEAAVTARELLAGTGSGSCVACVYVCGSGPACTLHLLTSLPRCSHTAHRYVHGFRVVGPGGCTSAPPKAKAKKVRANPPNSELRRFYERGDLPVAMDLK